MRKIFYHLPIFTYPLLLFLTNSYGFYVPSSTPLIVKFPIYNEVRYDSFVKNADECRRNKLLLLSMTNNPNDDEEDERENSVLHEKKKTRVKRSKKKEVMKAAHAKTEHNNEKISRKRKLTESPQEQVIMNTKGKKKNEEVVKVGRNTGIGIGIIREISKFNLDHYEYDKNTQKADKPITKTSYFSSDSTSRSLKKKIYPAHTNIKTFTRYLEIQAWKYPLHD